MSNRLFVLAHPDDEMLCLPILSSSPADPHENTYLLYLTLGSVLVSRQREMVRAATYLQRVIPNLFVIEVDLKLSDGEAWREVEVSQLAELASSLKEYRISKIVTFAYEGGHQDHDLAHVISYYLKSELSADITEFSGYRLGESTISLKVINPKEGGSRVQFKRSSVLWTFFRLCLIHKSQYKVWLILGPFILIRLLFRPYCTSKPTYWNRNREDALYLYEVRKKAVRLEVEQKFHKLLDEVLE